MKNHEVDEAIANNPGGTDLEIALAIGTDEKRVSDRRKHLQAEADKQKAAEDEKAAEAKRLEDEENARKWAEDQAAKKKKLEESKPIEPPAPVATEMGFAPAKQKYFLRDPRSGTSVELVRMNESRTMVIFETVDSQS